MLTNFTANTRYVTGTRDQAPDGPHEGPGPPGRHSVDRQLPQADEVHHTRVRQRAGGFLTLISGEAPNLSSRPLPGFPVFHRHVGNPLPLGALAFGASLMCLGLCLVHARGLTTMGIFLNIALPYGGIGSSLAGLWLCVRSLSPPAAQD